MTTDKKRIISSGKTTREREFERRDVNSTCTSGRAAQKLASTLHALTRLARCCLSA